MALMCPTLWAAVSHRTTIIEPVLLDLIGRMPIGDLVPEKCGSKVYKLLLMWAIMSLAIILVVLLPIIEPFCKKLSQLAIVAESDSLLFLTSIAFIVLALRLQLIKTSPLVVPYV